VGETTGIEWCDATWNPWQGCTKVSEGCANCYMYRDMPRFGKDPTVVRRSADATFYSPLKWREPKRIFVCSWSDFWHPAARQWRDAAWNVMLDARQHTYMIPTKRPQAMLDEWARLKVFDDGPLPHIWAGVSVENQGNAWRLAYLARVPAKVRFVSAEPLLSSLDLRQWLGTGGAQHANQGCAGTGFNRLGGTESGQPRACLAGNPTGGYGSSEGLSAGAIHSGGEAVRLGRTPLGVDGIQPPSDSRRVGNQPQGWQQGEQLAIESGSGHARLQCGSCPAQTGQATSEAYARREVDPRTSAGDRRTLSAEGPVETGDSRHVRRDRQDGSEHRAPREVDASVRVLDWVIAGGESGPKRRPSEADWFRALRDQCAAAGVPYFLKQMEVKWASGRVAVEHMPKLDGVRHQEWPKG